MLGLLIEILSSLKNIMKNINKKADLKIISIVGKFKKIKKKDKF